MRNAKRSWRMVVCGQRGYNPYSGVTLHVDSTSARKGLNTLNNLPSWGVFYALVFEPRTRVVISAAMRIDNGPAVSVPFERDVYLPENVPALVLDRYASSIIQDSENEVL